MGLTAVFAIVITLTAVLGFVNARFIKLPTTIGLMVAALVASLLLLAVGLVLPGIHDVGESVLERIDFDDLLMQGMLSFLLFAGALHVNLGDLLERKWSIGLLATLGVTISTFLIGSASWLLFRALGIDLPYIWALLFGALISPTDPIAVLGLLKRAKTPKSLETLITGESLFNDGVGVVVFLMLLGFIGAGHEVSVAGAAELFVVEALGGLALGFALGYVAYRMLKAIDDYVVEILITLALVAGGYTLASKLHMSGPLAMVVAGLMVGNHGRSFAMSDHTRENLDRFWELIDEILNAVLFVLIGLEVFVLDLNPVFLLAGVLAIPVVLASRFIACSVPITLLKPIRKFPPRTLTLLTWGGLRGGISVALALSLPASSPYREPILEATYVVVVFAILVQGLTVGKVARGIEA